MKVFAKKIGMSRVFDKAGKSVAVSVVELIKTEIGRIKREKGDGYDAAVYLGLSERSKTSKPLAGQFKGLDSGIVRISEERTNKSDEGGDIAVGKKISAADFRENDSVSISAVSKGKGFQGTVKRHGFNTGPKTHGSNNYRRPGSIGATTPSRVLKGKKMPGRLGGDRTTLKNIAVVRVEGDRNRLWLKGPIPGANKALFVISK